MTGHVNRLGSFEEIVWPLRSNVAKIIAKKYPGRNDLDDIVATTFANAWRAWPKFVPANLDDPTGSIIAWLTTIAKNQVINSVRAESRRKNDRSFDALESWQVDAIDELAEDVDFNARIANSELTNRFRAALQKIAPPYRQVVYLVVIEELSYVEVAEILEIPVGTVMSRLHRGRAALRKIWAPGDLAA